MSDAKESESVGSTSLRAFAVDTSSEGVRVIEGEDSDPGLVRPVRRIPLFAKLTFAVVIGGCVMVLGLCARVIYADRSWRHPHAVVAAPPPPLAVMEPLPLAASPPAVVASQAKPPAPVETKPTSRTVPRVKKAPAPVVDKRKAPRKGR